MLIDTHCHLNFQAFSKDADEVIRRALDNDVWLINVGSQLETSRKAVGLAEKYPQGVFAAIGLQPIHTPGISALVKNKLDPEELAAQEIASEFNIEDYKNLALSSKKVVAIGEIGLDYYYKPKTKARLEEFKNLQKNILLRQIDLARELNLPIAFHCRAAHHDLIEILNRQLEVKNNKISGVVHSFVGETEQAQKYLELGLHLGFTGIIFKRISGINFEEVIRTTPLGKILVETDSPYCAPLPVVALAKAGVAPRNEPLFVKQVVQEIARIKKLSYEEVAQITTQNARELFNI